MFEHLKQWCPMSPKKTLNLPEARYEQLTQFATKFNLTHSAALGEALEMLREKYKLEHAIPGVEAKIKHVEASDGSGIALKLGDAPIRFLSFDAARELASSIREYVADEKPRKTHLVNLDHNFKVFGVKRSTAIATTIDGVPWQTTPDIAKELADLLMSMIEQHDH